MKRRDILKTSALALGYTLMGGATFTMVNGCKVDTSETWTPDFLEESQMNILSAVVDRILPKTATPGAIDAGVDRYLDGMILQNFTQEEQNKFKIALNLFDSAAQKSNSKSFTELSNEEKDGVLQSMADAAKGMSDKEKKEDIFSLVKDMTVSAFFTSEVGATQVLKHVPVPGPYEGCVPFSEVGGVYSL